MDHSEASSNSPARFAEDFAVASAHDSRIVLEDGESSGSPAKPHSAADQEAEGHDPQDPQETGLNYSVL